MKPKEYGEIGSYARVKGSRNKHEIVGIESIGNHIPDMVIVVELCTKERTATTWDGLREWISKKR